MKKIITILLFLTFNAYADKIPEFSLPVHSSASKFILKEQLKGKKVVINFWASWCTSCIHEIPLLESLKAKYGNEAIFVAVNAGEKSNLIDRFLKKYKFSYIILNDESRIFSKSVGVDSLPVTMVIDKDLNIVYRDIVPPKEI